jgi:hydrogenase expression/formation protein HypD
MDLSKVINYLSNYDGEPIKIMEVCGSHTAAIKKSGIKSLLSPKIKLVSGPGCPVCVTASSYIDRLIELSQKENTEIVTFGDLMRVPGSESTLNEEKSKGAKVNMVYSPLDTIALALEKPDKTFVFAAIGFETTTPAYALLVDKIINNNIKNIKILTSLKVMPPALSWIMESGSDIDAFIAPGHVSVITGSRIYEEISDIYSVPMGICGFKSEELVLGIYGIIRMYNKKDYLISSGNGLVKNFYPSVVKPEGNVPAKALVNKYFKVSGASWRGLGEIENSGLLLKDEFSFLDAGSYDLLIDIKKNPACSCDKVLTGKMDPRQCPLFGKVCTPLNPQGACMVSEEGACQNSI